MPNIVTVEEATKILCPLSSARSTKERIAESFKKNVEINRRYFAKNGLLLEGDTVDLDSLDNHTKDKKMKDSFKVEDLPKNCEHLKPFCESAQKMLEETPDSPERDASYRALLKARNNLVRAARSNEQEAQQ